MAAAQMGLVDPVKDCMADVMAVRAGFESRGDVVARRGEDVETLDNTIAEDKARSEAFNLIFDSDASHTDQKGSIQTLTERMTQHLINEEE
ncbi:MAG: hypothetical protein U5L76_02440 [Patescibacteria group bacterium]|nr:hypothetical protein [Patescibacteria group bacterium]